MKNFSFFNTIKTMACLALAAFTFTACDDDEGMTPTEQELITTVRLTFTNGGNALVFNAVDADGDGGNPIVIDEIKLAPNTAYSLKVEFFDEQNPADVENITLEVAEEDLEHLVCFASSGVPAPTDLGNDSNGNPLGLNSMLTTTGAATGTMQVSLKHEPDKAAADPCATGETDVEVTFPVTIE